MQPIVRAASEDLRARQVRAVEALGGLVADGDHATSRAFAADASLFSADRFHPSSAGYAVIAAALLPVVTAAAARV
jgi:lysophospholipase L1-like esterase